MGKKAGNRSETKRTDQNAEKPYAKEYEKSFQAKWVLMLSHLGQNERHCFLRTGMDKKNAGA